MLVHVLGEAATEAVGPDVEELAGDGYEPEQPLVVISSRAILIIVK